MAKMEDDRREIRGVAVAQKGVIALFQSLSPIGINGVVYLYATDNSEWANAVK